VSDGAISFYLNHFVSVRIAKWTYGTEMMALYNANDRVHAARTKVTLASGRQFVDNKWDTIIARGVQVSEATEFTRSYAFEAPSRALLERIETTVRCYRGTRAEAPEWVDEEPDGFPDLCKIIADTSQAAANLQPAYGTRGQYFSLSFKIVLQFGLTEYKAQVSWIENGVEKRSPATVIYEQDNNDDEALNNMIAELTINPAPIHAPSRNSVAGTNRIAQTSLPRPGAANARAPPSAFDTVAQASLNTIIGASRRRASAASRR
jgi:hypothetical protein